MAFTHCVTRVLVALNFFTAVLAAVTFDAYKDPSANFTVAVNVPSNGTDDLYFHLTASTQFQWGAFGFGSQMKGSLMFIMYTSQDGKNVTVSPRIATGEMLPQYTDSVKVTLLSGSGVQDNALNVANVHCTGCRKWVSGNIDTTSTDQPVIYAVGPKNDVLKSNDVNSRLSIHAAKSVISLNLKKATGEAGVPIVALNTNSPSENQDPESKDGETQAHEFPIAIHAFLLIACFLFILPGGYLSLRVFNRVWLHAGMQSLGIVCLMAGVAAGIVFNVQVKKAISYHQVLGIITTFLVFAAFTLGLISHQYYKKRKVSSPLLKFHRMTGPAAIVLGWGTTISGFVFRGEPRRILPFMVVLLAVVIFVGSIAFLMKRRAVRKAATQTTAAQNFNAGYYQQGAEHARDPPPPAYPNAQGFYGPGPGYGEGVPMQTFPPQQGGYAPKPPNVNVRPVH